MWYIFQIHKVNTSSYHPKSDGLVERFNSTLCQSLSMNVAKDQKDWDEYIPLVLFAHRTSVCGAIGDSPFYVLYGREPRLPTDVKLLPKESEDLSSSVFEHRKRRDPLNPILRENYHVTLMQYKSLLKYAHRQWGFWDRGSGTPTGSQSSPSGIQIPGPRTPHCLCV